VIVIAVTFKIVIEQLCIKRQQKEKTTNLDSGATESRAEHERGVVELVAQNKAALAHEHRNVHGVGGEAHAKGHARLRAQKLAHARLQPPVHLVGAELF